MAKKNEVPDLRSLTTNEITKQVMRKLDQYMSPLKIEELVEKIILRRANMSVGHLDALIRRQIEVNVGNIVKKELDGFQVRFEVKEGKKKK